MSFEEWYENYADEHTKTLPKEYQYDIYIDFLQGELMPMPDYDKWIESLSEEEYEDVCVRAGGDDKYLLEQVYYEEESAYYEAMRDEERDMKLIEGVKDGSE